MKFKNLFIVILLSFLFSCQKSNDSSSVGIKTVNENIPTLVNKTSAPNTQQNKVYVALLNQSGINNPTAIELQNTLGNIVWTRTETGVYDGFLLHGFPIGKTFVVMGGTGILETIYLNQNDDSRVTISLNIPSDFSGQDDRLRYTAIEIRVYP